MNSNDRDGFNAQVALLCGGFNVPATEERIEGLWVGLRNMNLIAFTRVVEHALGPSGTPKFPTVRDCWNIYNDLKSARNAPTAAPVSRDPPPDRLMVITAKMLWMLIYRAGPFTPALLQDLLEAKAKLVEDYRLICAEEAVSDAEFGEAVYAKYRQVLAKHAVTVPDFSAAADRRRAA